MSTSAADALPYYDRDIDLVEGLRAQLESLVEAELQSSPEGSSSALSERLPPEIPELFSGSTLLQSEVARVSSSAAKPKTGPKAGLDTIRYTLPAPPLSAPLTAWNKALDNAASQLEHQGIRLSNLEMLSKYGANAWRVSNYLVEQEIARLQASTESVKTATDEINRERKAKQLEAGDQLSSLQARWTSLVSGNLQLELANMTLEMEVDALREREAELSQQLQQVSASS